MEVTVSAENIARVKGLGFLQCKGTDNFNCRVITRNGKINNEELSAITNAAKKFGNGEVSMTTRLTIEIQQVPYENIDAIIEYLKGFGLSTGGTGKKVRPVVSCKGTTCQYGLIDSYDLSMKIHTKFYEGYRNVVLPHKFKIAVGGCPNNCVKPNLNDFGIVGQRVLKLNTEKCHGCKKCMASLSCPIKVSSVVDGKYNFSENCNNCGRCMAKCPFHAIEEDYVGYKVYLGGRWGKGYNIGKAMSKIFTSEEELFAVIEKAIDLFKNEGIDGERFSDTIDRLGFEYVENKLN